MSQYTPVVNFLSKDSLVSGNPLKALRGADLTTEFTAVQTALNSKIDGVVQFAPDGTVGQPSYGFTNNNGTGMYQAGGVLNFATSGIQRLSVASGGAVTLSAPTSGTAFTVSALAGQLAQSISAGPLFISNAGLPLVVLNSSGSNFGLISNNGANAWSLGTGTSSTGAGTQVLGWNATGNVTIPTPSSGTALSVNGVANANTLVVAAPNTSGQSFGLDILAGTSSSDYGIQINNAANSVNYFRILGDGSGVLGSPTGGGQGVGTLNATGLFVNGVSAFGSAPQSASTTAATTDIGKSIIASGSITVPNSTFAAGNLFSIYNNTAGSITITAGIATMRLGGTATTGSRTLATRGLANVYFVSGTECIVSGAGVS